jgi:acyl carrier protein
MNSVRQEIRDFIIKSFLFGEDGGLADDTSLLEQGVIDSTGLLEIAAYLEKAFEVKVNPDEFESLDSIDSIIELLERKQPVA